MRQTRLLRKAFLGATAILGGGLLLENGGCMNLALSISPCGTVLATCTPADWANMIFPFIDVPDFRADPSCTIPLGCGDSDLLPPLVGGPGGGGSAQPPTGGGGTGGGGAGGGI